VEFTGVFDLSVTPMSFHCTIDEILQAKVLAKTVIYRIQVIFHFGTNLL
jgi:hypothetical protein